MLSIAELLDKAAEYDLLAKNAAKPERKARCANIAKYFRYLAGELDILPSSSADSSPTSPP